MALARAFMEGPRPRRSLLFVWHTGEEVARYGSLYFADYPTVPVDSIVAQLNLDMIGRNRDDKARRSQHGVSGGIRQSQHGAARHQPAANAAVARP